ncbi:MAG: 4Fe-4S binding protein [Lachnospiraceae bacterium]|jgi:ferredoxin/flavodoxin
MKIKRICLLYFSPAGTTAKAVKAAGKALSGQLGLPLEENDFTPAAARQKDFSFDSSCLVIVGSPTYAGKLPNKILPDFKTRLTGGGAPAIAIVTYGNRSYDNALAELCAVLEGDGFRPAAGAALSCRHAFSDQIGTGRPDEQDLAQIRAFALQSGRILSQSEDPGTLPALTVPGDADAPYYVPKMEDGQPARFLKAKPKVDFSLCTRCGRCAALCPMASIDPEDPSKIDGICIKCQACIRGCPQHALYFDDPAFLSHVRMLTQNFTQRRENAFFFCC